MLVGIGLKAERQPGRPGLFHDGMKIASLGLRCEHGVASHGSSVNVDMDLSLFDLITSCGEPALRQTSIVSLTGRPLSMEDAKARYVDAFTRVFDLILTPLRHTTCAEMLGKPPWLSP